MAKLRITQVASKIKYPGNQKRTLDALGLRRMNQTVELEDSPQLRGMIVKVRHLVSVEERGE
jgi:large subunit ribosomal protein L30